MSVGVNTSVSLVPFQERFREMEPPEWSRNGMCPKDAANTIALRLGWFDSRGYPDGPRVRRTLGLRLEPRDARNGRSPTPKLRERTTFEMADRLCEAMDLDPLDVGL